MQENPAAPYRKLEAVAPGQPEVAGGFVVEAMRGLNLAVSELADDPEVVRMLRQTRRQTPRGEGR